MIAVNFYNFSKKENSTKRPAAGTATVINCVLKDVCSVESPVLELQTATPPALYTYAYIADFNRYYWVTDRSYYQGRWIVRLRTDILATFKDQIGASTQYVLRSASESNARILDSYYLTKAFPNLTRAVSPDYESGDSWFDGESCYVVGIVGPVARNNQVHQGSVSYWVFTEAKMRQLSEYLYSDSFASLIGDSSVGFTTAVVKGLVNPAQYITSAMYLPVSLSSISGTEETVKIGWYAMSTGTGDITAKPLLNVYYELPDQTITIPQHPQLSRGSYLAASPFTRYTMQFEPFGTFPLDPARIGTSTTLYCTLTLDPITGTARFSATCDTDALGTPIYGNVFSRTAQIGVPVQLAQIDSNIGASIPGLVAAAASVATGTGALAAVGGASAGLLSALDNALPSTTIQGSTGSYISFKGSKHVANPLLFTEQYLLSDENLDHAGRPLCEERLISTLSGYILCADGELDISCTDSERAAITAYLTGGFFYE